MSVSCDRVFSASGSVGRRPVGCLLAMLPAIVLTQSVCAAEPSHFRPSRSEPAFEIERGEIEFEVGLLSTLSRADGRQLRSYSAPLELRMGFAPGWLVQVGMEGPATRRETGAQRDQELGSSSIAVRHARPISDSVWASILVGTELATERSPEGDRSAPYIQTALTWYADRLRLTGVAKYGRNEEFSYFEHGVRASVGSVSLASFYDLSEQWGIAADVNFDRFQGQGIQRSYVTGIVWRVNRRVLIDVGIGGGQGIIGTQRLFTAGTIIYF